MIKKFIFELEKIIFFLCLNAAKNIGYIAHQVLMTGIRPAVFCKAKTVNMKLAVLPVASDDLTTTHSDSQPLAKRR
jgi:hypothetical protein